MRVSRNARDSEHRHHSLNSALTQVTLIHQARRSTPCCLVHAHRRPALVEAVVDPNTPPMPGKIKAQQAVHLAEALARGEVDRKTIIAEVIKDRARELV